jgi:DNA gyrase subunit A
MPKNNEKDNQNHSQVEKTKYGLVRPRIIEDEMRESYLDYAMSVIIARALPDVRDGLKPVHRRVLYSMYDMGLTSKSKYRKSASVVGDVLGKYHPHGDIAVYDTLVRMAQDFAMRNPLVDGQGNFGSVDGDEAAAMRYTECRMSKLAEEMLIDIEKNTVDFIDNYDATRKEPKVLPAKVPNLLLNGSMGIAVGMATNIPPHNLGEIIDATIQTIDNPDIDVEELMGFVKGPDFPTGGNIYNIEEIKNAYATGQGKVVMRAESEILEGERGQFRIIVTEIPFQVNKANLIEQMANLVKDKKITGISDIRDESDKDGIRIVIELKRDAFPQKVLNQLYKHTQMQDAFHMNMLALVDGIQPRVLTLKNIIAYYIAHRKNIVVRRTKFDLGKAKAHAHILEGLLKALKNIDQVIATIKKSADRNIAHKNLVKKFALSPKQAEAILEMRLSILSGLERQKIEKDYQETKRLIAKLEKILGSEKEILKVIKAELVELKTKFATPRKTKVFKKGINDFEAIDLIPDEQVIVTLTLGNYIKRMPISAYRSQRRGGKGVLGITTKEEDIVNVILEASTHDDLLYFTNKGRVFTSKVYEIVSTSRQAKGQAIVNLLAIAPEEETITNIINISSRENLRYLIMATKKGLVKKTNILAYQKVRKSGLIAIRLRKEDELGWVRVTSGEDQIVLATKKGMAIKFEEKDIRPMGRAASGVRGIRLRSGDQVIGMEVAAKKSAILHAGDQSEIAEYGRKSLGGDVLVVTENAKGKKTPLKFYPIQRRGGIGLRTARINTRTGDISQMRIIEGIEADLAIISKKGQVIRMPLRFVKRLGRATVGVRLMRLNVGDKVASITILEKVKEDESQNNGTNKIKKIAKIKSQPERLKSKVHRTKTRNRKGSKKMQKPKKLSGSRKINMYKYGVQAPKKKIGDVGKTKKLTRKSNEPNFWGNQGIWKRKSL